MVAILATTWWVEGMRIDSDRGRAMAGASDRRLFPGGVNEEEASVTVLDAIRSGPGVGRDPRGRSEPAARRRHRHHSTAAGVRKIVAVPPGGDLAATTAAARPGIGTTSPAASTPARISTRRSTGSPARIIRATPPTRIPAEKFLAPACVIDVSREAAADPDFLLTPQHVEDVGDSSTAASKPAPGC